MAQPMPKHPNLVGGFAPIQMECDAPDLVIEGRCQQTLPGLFPEWTQPTVCAARRTPLVCWRWHAPCLSH